MGINRWCGVFTCPFCLTHQGIHSGVKVEGRRMPVGQFVCGECGNDAEPELRKGNQGIGDYQSLTSI